MNRLTSHLSCLIALLSACCASTVVAQEVAAEQVPAGKQHLLNVPDDFFAYSDNGVVRFRVMSLEALSPDSPLPTQVRLIGFDGQSMAARIGRGGHVEFQGVNPGPYAVIVTGPGMYMASAMFVSASDRARLSHQPLQFPVIPVRDDLEIRSYASLMPTRTRDQVYQTRMQFDRYTTRDKGFYRTELNADGDLLGNVYAVTSPDQSVDYSGTTVTIYRAGQKVREAEVNSGGSFVLRDFPSGTFYTVVSGPLGYAAFGFEVLKSVDNGGQPVAEDAGGVGRKASFRGHAAMQAGLPLDVLLIPGPIIPAIEDAIEQDLTEREFGELGVAPPSPMAGGTGAGGGGAGGGGGGAGGGDLLGAAALAALAAALADSDSTGPLLPPDPASPPVVVE